MLSSCISHDNLINDATLNYKLNVVCMSLMQMNVHLEMQSHDILSSILSSNFHSMGSQSIRQQEYQDHSPFPTFGIL